MINKINPENFEKIFSNSVNGEKIAITKLELLYECHKRTNENNKYFAKDFVREYNSGLILPEKREIISEISVTKLANWKRDLKNSTYKDKLENWTVLIPAVYFKEFLKGIYSSEKCWIDFDSFVKISGLSERTVRERCNAGKYIRKSYFSDEEKKYIDRILIATLEPELKEKALNEGIEKIKAFIDVIDKIKEPESYLNIVFNELLKSESFKNWTKNNLQFDKRRLP